MDRLYSGRAGLPAAENALGRVIQIEKDSQLAARALFALAAIYRREGKTDQAAHEMVQFHRLQGLKNDTTTPRN